MGLRFLGQLGGAIGGVAAATVISGPWGAVVGAVVAFGSARIFSPKDETNELIDRGINVNTVSNVADIPVVYGRRRIGGPQILRDTGGSNNKYLYAVQVLSEGPIEGNIKVYFDGRDVIEDFDMTTDDGGFTWRGDKLRYNIHLGDDDQLADGMLVDNVTSWTDAHRGRGIAYIAFRLSYDPDKYPTGIPLIEVEFDGKRVFDPRTGLDTKTTTNPVLQLRDYMTNTRYGRRIPVADMDDAVIGQEADYCDQLITFSDGVQRKRYESNAYLAPQDGLRTNCLKLATAARVFIIRQGWVWRCIVDKEVQPEEFEFNESNILGGWNFSLGGKSDRFNKMKLRIQADAARNWKNNLTVIESAQFLAEDNDQANETELELPCTTDLERATMIGIQELKQSRQSITVEVVASPEAIRCEVGRVYNITHHVPGWTAKPFRLIRMELTDDENYACTLLEYDPSVYDLSGVDTPAQIPDSDLPDPFNVAPVTNLQAISNDSTLLLAGDGTIQARIFASWDPSPDGFAIRYEIRWRINLETGWTAFTTTDTEVYIQPVRDGKLYDVQVRAIGITGTNASEWRTVTVIARGKDAPPPDVPSFSVTESPIGQRIYEWTYNDTEVLDLDGFVIRYGVFGERDWDSMIPLHTNVIKSSPYYAELPFSGSWAFAIRAIDRSRNLSENPFFIDATLVQETGTFLFRAQPWAQGFPGTLTNCRGSGSLLSAISRGNWSTPTSWELFNTWVVDPEPSIVYQYELPGGGEIDLGSAQLGVPFSSGQVPSDATLVEFEYATSSNGTSWSAWASTVGAAAVSSRYWRFRVRVEAPYAYVRQYQIAVQRA